MDIEELSELVKEMKELRKEMEELRKEMKELRKEMEESRKLVKEPVKRKKTEEIELPKEDKDEFVNWMGWYEFDKKKITYFTLSEAIMMCGMESKGIKWDRAFAKFLEFELGVPREAAGNRRFKFRSLD